jgi:acyl carrier protein
MTDIDQRLAQLLRAHAPAMTLAGPGSALAALGPDMELRGDLGFDEIALAELAVAVEDAFGIDLDTDDLAACRTIRDLHAALAARVAPRRL